MLSSFLPYHTLLTLKHPTWLNKIFNSGESWKSGYASGTAQSAMSNTKQGTEYSLVPLFALFDEAPIHSRTFTH
jgi:hypothetical protein